MTDRSRRLFLRNALCATASSAAFGSMYGKLSLAHAATVPHLLLGSDYRALVCIYLSGGNDSFNMLVPRDTPHYNTYAATRGALALPQAELLAINPTVAPSDGAQYGLHPRMGGLRDLFESGRAAIVANTGPLLYPTTKAQYQNESVPVPAQLASHSDQEVLWQLPQAEASGARLGWGGKLADIFFANNGNPNLSMNISLGGENVFQAGAQVSPYFMSRYGVDSIWPIENPGTRRAAFDALMAQSHAHAFERTYVTKLQRARLVSAEVGAALDTMPANQAPFNAFDTAWTNLPAPRATPDIGRELQMIARMIALRGTLQMTRQIFFVDIGGFDTHGTQLVDHAELMEDLSVALKTFHDVMASAQMNLANKVTTFTASEFGRSLFINGDGTDHAWGAHHIVVGGGVNGRRIYGTMPSLLGDSDVNPDDTGYGQIIPTTAVDQYAATLARWYGLADTDRALMFPNLSRFAASNLGFMA